MKETLEKLQTLYEQTTPGEWTYDEKFAFNNHVSKKEINGGLEKARMRVGIFTKSADGKFLAEVHKAWPEIMKKSTQTTV